MLEVQLFQSIFYKSVSVMKMIYEKALHLRCSVALKLIKSSARNRSRSNDGTIDSTGETHRFISKRKRKEETERGECLCILLLTPPPFPRHANNNYRKFGNEQRQKTKLLNTFLYSSQSVHC
jgi:hypothetical protein